MKIVHFPTFLGNNFVDHCINMFDYWMHTLLQSKYNPHFYPLLGDDLYTLEFSDELIMENLGGISFEQAKKIILETWRVRRDDKHSLELIKRIREAQTVQELQELASWIAETCIDEDGEYDYKKSRERIENILDNVIDVSDPSRFYVLGRYFHSTKTVVLYTKAILKSQKTPATSLFEETFIHELTHAYHYFDCEDAVGRGVVEINERTDYTSTVVKESFAAFFEYYYCHRCNLPTDIDTDWSSNSIGIYPYSGAKYLLPLAEKKTTLLIDVLEASYSDFDKALRILLSSNIKDFYLVKNHKEVETVAHEKTKTLYASTSILIEMDEWLHKMGIGWFILRYASDHGMPSPIPLDYGSPKAVATREYVYRSTAQYHNDMIKYLKSKRLFFRTHAGIGNMIVSARELEDVLKKLI